MFEESKGWLFAFTLAILIAVGYTSHYLSLLDETNARLQESKTKLAGMEDILALRKRIWSDTEQARTRLEELSGHSQILAKARETLDQRLQLAAANLRSLNSGIQVAVQRTRKNAVGVEAGTIVLRNGNSLKNATIRKVEDTGVSIIHSDGIGTFTPADLPPEVNERFDLGSAALLPKFKLVLDSLDASKNTAATPKKSTSHKSPELQRQIASLQVSLESAEQYVRKLESEVKTLDREIQNAEFARTPTRLLRSTRDVTEGNAGMARNEVAIKKAELSRLRALLEAR